MNKTEKLNEKLYTIPHATLIEMIDAIILKLSEKGDKAFTMNIPPKETYTDLLLSEMLRRYKSMLEATMPAPMPAPKTKNLYKLHYESCHHFAVAESIGAAEQIYKNNMGLLNEKGFLEISPIAIEKIGDDVNKHLDITDSLILIQD